MMQHAMLNVLEGPLQGRALAITQHENLVGREPGCELLLEGYTRVSRRHARLHWDGWQFHVTDLGSTNGVLVDGQPIQSIALRGGSVLHIGDFVAQLWLPPSPPLFLDQPPAPATIPARTAVLPPGPAYPASAPQGPLQGPAQGPLQAPPAPYPPQPPLQHPAPYPPVHPPLGAPVGPPMGPGGAPMRRAGGSIPGTPTQRIVAGAVALGVVGLMLASGSGGGQSAPRTPAGSPQGNALVEGGVEPDATAGSQLGVGGKISAQSIARGKAATVLIAHAEGEGVAMGSGFVTGDGRHIVTNRHVVVDESGQPTECVVVFNSGGSDTSKIKIDASKIELAPSAVPASNQSSSPESGAGSSPAVGDSPDPGTAGESESAPSGESETTPSGEGSSGEGSASGGMSEGFTEDLAVITLPERVVEPLQMGRTEDLTETDTVYAVGFPLGVGTLTLGGALPSASVKAVSVERLQRGKVDGAEAVGVLQLGGTITHGNSGGPILNARGEVVGVVSRGAEGTGMSYAIPTVFVKGLL